MCSFRTLQQFAQESVQGDDGGALVNGNVSKAGDGSMVRLVVYRDGRKFDVGQNVE